ncbi:MAG: prenyltransferase [Candidatus Eisenbacteria bacterium]|uniref:1,4-dihydroxy-2-naphthoate octaprenyltransferase n=1 Tax=Eiseniibacteriota bacterium TaxID=2212470 RepID=A0A937XBH9_UNCEI|nr:prenyltransferase [Candidatus Eisenbacteria bacterium]
MSRIPTWWMATRPFAFPASIMPALLGGVVALVHAGARLDALRFLLAALGAAAVHAGANLLNDYFDYRNGVDTAATRGASRGMLVSGRMTPREVLLEAFVCWGIAAALALYFVLAVGPLLLPLIAAGLVLGAGYTAAPLRWKYRALGDACVFLAFGVGVTLGAYAVQAGRLSWTPVWYSLPVGLLIWAILHANNLRDIATDRAARIRTLAMALGARGARGLYAALLAAAYLLTLGFVLGGVFKPGALLPWLSLPLAAGLLRGALRAGATPEAAPGAGLEAGPPVALVTLDIRTAQLQMVFVALLVLGLLGSLVL